MSDAGTASTPKRREADLYQAADRHVARFDAIKTVAWAIAVPVTVLALWPVANEVAGRTTSVDVNIALSLTVAVTVAWAATGATLKRARSRMRLLMVANDKLEGDLLRETGAREVAERRVGGLETDLAGVRADLERIRTLSPS